MEDALRMLERWDAGEPVQVLRLTNGGPIQEQSAHLLAFELLRDGIGLPLPDGPPAWAAWGADALARTRALAGIDLPASSISTAKAYAFNLMRSGWEALGGAAPPMNHIMVSRTLPGMEPPVSPKTVAAAKEHDRLAAWILAEMPEEIRGDTDDPSATGIAIRLMAERKAGAKPTLRKGDIPPRGGSGEANALPPVGPPLSELLTDLEERLGDKLEESISEAVRPIVVRLNALEGGERKPGKARPQPLAGAGETGPIVVGQAEVKGPAVVEGKRPTGRSSFPETERGSGR